MRKIKVFKIIIAILIAITLFITFSQNSLALNYDIGNKFEGKGDKGNATNTVAGLIGKTINAFQVFAAGFSIIMLIFVAVRWIGASPSGKAQMAKSIRYYIIGAIIIFAAIGLLQIVKNFTNGSFNKQFK